MRIKLGIKAFSIVSGMVLSLGMIAGCNEETPAPAPAPARPCACKLDMKPAGPRTPPRPPRRKSRRRPLDLLILGVRRSCSAFDQENCLPLNSVGGQLHPD